MNCGLWKLKVGKKAKEFNEKLNMPEQLEFQFTTEPTQKCFRESVHGGIHPTKCLESDPTGKSPHEPGAKLDAGKAPIFQGVLQYFPRAIREVAFVSLFGANKYAWKGWESVPNGIERYGDALSRHVTGEAVDGSFDKETGLRHAAQVAWNALARLELILRDEEEKEKQKGETIQSKT